MRLELKELEAGYGTIQVLWGVSLEVDGSEIVALLGPNGAGKTTTLRTTAGFLKVTGGDIVIDGRSIVGQRPDSISRGGIGLVSETLNLFPDMTVRENLLLGGYAIRDMKLRMERLSWVCDCFPRLGERQRQRAGTLSGGERKMLAIGRAMMLKPDIFLVDEPSLGLSPRVTQEVFEVLKRLREEGHGVLVVEQNVQATLEMADRAYVLERGEIKLRGLASELLENETVRNVYMGIS